MDRALTQAQAVADIEGDLAGADLEMFERPADRFLDHGRAAVGIGSVTTRYSNRSSGVFQADMPRRDRY